jgi:hypothetical protein
MLYDSYLYSPSRMDTIQQKEEIIQQLVFIRSRDPEIGPEATLVGGVGVCLSVIEVLPRASLALHAERMS